MITDEKIKEVLTEMARVHRTIDAHRQRLAVDEYYFKHYTIIGGPETAAIKRASLDLSRALSRLRRA